MGRSETDKDWDILSGILINGLNFDSSIEIRSMVGELGKYFWITCNGDIISRRTGKILKQTPTRNGYSALATRIGGRRGKAVLVRTHVQVALAFIPNPDGKPFVNHKDGNKTNPKKDNLEWVTTSENCIHAYRTGLRKPPRGVNQCRYDITKELIADILIDKNRMSINKIHKKYNINRKTIAKIIRGQYYLGV